MEILEQILDGRQIEIHEFRIIRNDLDLTLHINFMCGSKLYNVVFYNASRINIADFSLPIQIEGPEVVSNFELGWDSDSRYLFNDFEGTTLNFYFEDFEIINSCEVY